MSGFLTRNRLQLVKIETTPGVDAVPVPATDAILVEEPRGSKNMELEQTDEVSGSLDSTQSIVGGGYAEHTGRFFAKGSGAAGTPPEADAILQAASLGLTTLAADSSGTAQAGAAASITLAVGAPSSNLTGFVVETTGGTGAGQTRVITAYNTATKLAAVYPNWTTNPDATTTYAVRAGNRYAPASTNLKNVTSYLYKKNAAGGNAILEKVLGAASSLSFAIQTRQTGKFTYGIRGMLLRPEDVANPAAAVFDTVRPRPLRDADAILDGRQVCFRNFTLDLGITVIQPDCAHQEFGYDPALVTGRKMTARINPQVTVLSDRNPFADLVAGLSRPLWLCWGETAGNRMSIFIPALIYTGQEDDDLDGISADGLPFELGGVDNGLYITFF